MNRTRHLIAVLTAFAAPAVAQVPPNIPYQRTLDLMVVDSLADVVWRLSDFDLDGDYNDPGEVLSFYDDVTGAFVLTNPACIATAYDGTVYIGDSTEDVVLALRDQTYDGDANDPGEARVFFDNSNASGAVLSSVQGITVDALGRVFLAVANTTTGGTDQILKLEDLNQDGDANDPGEATDYCTIPGGAGAPGNSIPTEVRAGPDNNLYYTETGSTGVVTKGVWKLTDGNFDGDCNDPGEVTLFWTPGPQPLPNTPFHYSLAISRDGWFYVTDHSANEQVWRGKDLDASGTIDPTEETLFYQTGGSTWWDIEIRDDGWIMVCEDETPDRITALKDGNGDGDALDPNESFEAYSELVSPTDIPRPRGAAFLRAPMLSLSPPVVQLGQTVTFVVTTEQPQQLAAALLSTGLVPPFPVPPLGQVEIDPSGFVILGVGISTPGGAFLLPLTLPSAPTALGTWGSQALSGEYRFFLSNGSLLTVTP